MPLAVLQHSSSVTPGLFASQLPADVEVVRLDRGDPVPAPGRYEGIVVLGGIMGAYDEAEYPFLFAEKAMLRETVAAAIPVLGICLGCQLLAEALGGAAYRAPRLEMRFEGCALTAAGAADPVVRWLGEPVLSFHQDTWDLPPGAELLATSSQYPQAFRLGSALGIQPHPEVTPDMLQAWLEEFPPDRFDKAGVDSGTVLAQVEAGRVGSEELAMRLFAAWLDEVRQPPPNRVL